MGKKAVCFPLCTSCGLVALLLVGAKPSGAQAPTNYSLMWGDDFAGIPTSAGIPAVDTTRWWWRINYSSNGSQLPVNVTLDGSSNMKIANTSKVVSGATYYSGGGLISHQTFRYGYYQVAAQTPANSSKYHTAFWLSALGPTGADVTSWNPAPSANFLEIDGFEIDTTTPSSVSTGWLSWSGYGATNTASARCNASYQPGFDTSAASHTYGIEWTETAITYYIDGSSYCTQGYTATLHAESPVNIWLTSIPFGATGTPTPGAQAVFSSPQYYIRDYYINAEDTGYAEYGGNWTNSGATGFSSQPVRYTCTAGQYASYTPNLLAAGNYDVQVYQVIVSPMDTATTVTLTTASGAVNLPVGTLPTTGSSGWVDLGSYTFAAGNAANVSFINGNNCLRSSMVKFVRK